MINEFRTLLLNLSYNGDFDEYIPEEFIAKQLPKELQDIYSQLFPMGTSRTYKCFLANCYLNLIRASGLQDYVTMNDDRITYDLDTNFNFFKFYRTSNPISSAPTTLKIFGQYTATPENDDYYDHFLVEQVGATTTINVSSVTNERNYTRKALVFDGASNTGSSQLIEIPRTNLNLQFYAASSFTDTSDQTWEFTAEAPYTFNFSTIYNRLKASGAVATMLTLPVDDKTPESYWKQHFNAIYALAGLVIAYVLRIP